MKLLFLVTLGVVLLSCCFFSGVVQAQVKAESQAEFATYLDVSYRILSTEETQVTYQIELENNFSTIYATQYVLEVNSPQINNVQAVLNSGEALPFNVNNGSNTTTVVVQFPDKYRVIGREQRQKFKLSFISADIASQYGQILEVNIPKLADSEKIADYRVSVFVPPEFGEPSVVQPKQYRFEAAPEAGVVQFSNVGQGEGISILFGESQIYELNLAYHLQNSSQNIAVVEVALPPDTAWQQMRYLDITPLPEEIKTDIDGNWIAQFRLAGQAESTVSVRALAKIFASARPDFAVQSPLLSQNASRSKSWWRTASQTNYLQATEYWPVQSSQFQKLSKQYQTPLAIYDYVVDALTYNYQRFNQADAQKRQGALAALDDPANAVCTDFTDVFVTLARAAGLPARRVTGYAVTSDSRLRPLSLVADVLHAWPEYYDASAQRWVPVDPTWADTTGGVDYFHTFDLRHIAFAIQGQNDIRPLPAGMYKLPGQEQKDIAVEVVGEDGLLTDGSLAQLPEPEFLISKQPSYLPNFGLPTTEQIIISNNSGVAAYNIEVAFGLQGQLNLLSEPVVTIDELLPYSEYRIPVELSSSSWWQANSGQLKVLINEQQETYNISARRALESKYRQPWVVGSFVAVVCASAGSVLVFVLRRSGFIRR